MFCVTEKKFKYIYQMPTDGTLQDVKALASGRDNQETVTNCLSEKEKISNQNKTF